MAIETRVLTDSFIKMAAYVSTHDRAVLSKCYEDGKVSVIQNSAHKDILNIGNNLYQKIISDHKKEQQQNVTEVELRAWHLASEEKEKAVKAVKDAAELELEKAMATAKKAQEKAVKAESKRVEALMKKLAAQQVQQEKDEGQKRLEQALIQAREEFLVEKSEAIQNEREEGKALAAAEAKRVAKLEEEKRKSLILAAEKEKQKALKNLKERLKQEEKQAVKEMGDKCKKKEAENLKQQQEKHEREIKELESRVTEQINERKAVEQELERIEELKEKVVEKLNNTITSFQNFIDTTEGFNRGQANFLILDPLEGILEESQTL